MRTINRSFIIKALIIVAVLVGAWQSYAFLQRRSDARQLAEIYQRAMGSVDDRNNAFYPEAQLHYQDSLLHLSGNTPKQTISAEYYKADALLKLGQERAAVDLLTDVVEKLKIYRGQAPADDPRKLLALAYLRLGERNNCISHHGQGSCIFPIQGGGVYTDLYASQKAIDLYQQLLTIDSNDLESRWLLNLAYMTIGEYPRLVPAAMLIPGLDMDTSTIKVKPFTDIAMGLGLANHSDEAGGVIVDDFDNDGYLDIVTSDWDPDHPMHYYKNNGNGTFTDLSARSGLDKVKGAFNLLQVDYNNDGFTDIMVLRGGWRGHFGRMPLSLLKNNGDGTFTDVTLESGLLSFRPTQAGVWADFNNDGWPDLFVGNETTTYDEPNPCELWINNQDGTFSEVAEQAGCAIKGYIKGVTSADYDKDGWPDIFLSGRDGKKILFRNKGLHAKIPQFDNATHQAGLDKDTTYTFPTWFWDYDNDGWPDIFVCGYRFKGTFATAEAAQALHKPTPSAGIMYLYHNNHDGTFTNVSKATGLDRTVFAMGSNFGDIDNDGWLDMYLGTGNPDFSSLTPNHLFKNINGKYFTDVTGSARVGNLQKGHGVAIVDMNNDGYPDIFEEMGGAYKGDAFYNSFYLNPGQNENNWIVLKLEGVHSNRSAIGAHIIVSFTENGVKRTVYRDVNSGGSFGASPLRQQIGIGQATKIDELTIQWPATGIVQTFKDLSPRQYITIKEGDNDYKKVNLKTFSFQQKEMPMNMTGM